MALILRFRNRADLTHTGAAGHTTLTRVEVGQVGAPRTHVGNFQSGPTNGDGLPDWTDHAVDVTGLVSKTQRNIVAMTVIAEGTVGNNWDTSHVANLRLEDTVSGETWNAEYPEGAPYPDAIMPDGVLPAYELGQRDQNAGTVWNVCEQAFVNTGGYMTFFLSMGLVAHPCGASPRWSIGSVRIGSGS